MKFLEEANLTNKRVLLRLGTDVPLDGASERTVSDDSRLRESLPTIYYLLNRDAKLILLGHLGRPAGVVKPELSLRPVFLRLSALLNKSIAFAPHLFSDQTKDAVNGLKSGQLLGLENLRFDPGEEQNSRTFARKLADYGELYVDDAFSVAHRSAASMVAITEFLPSYAGLLFEKEYHLLTNLLRHPASPFVAIIGGAKVKDKLPVIRQLLEKADRVLIGGGVANTFLAASGQNVGASVVEPELFPVAQEIMKRAKGKAILPIDFKQDGGGAIYDIGPNTVAQFSRYITSAKTIFWNGNLGKSEDPNFRQGSDAVAQLVADAAATTIVGGGNTTEILNRLGVFDKITFVSSGGGAALALLSGGELPGVKALG